MRSLLVFLVTFSSLCSWAQESRRTSFFIGGSCGGTFVFKEAFALTTAKTQDMSPGLAFNGVFGLEISAKEKGFSQISLGYRSNSNGLKGLVDANTASNTTSTKNSTERYNYFTASYSYNHYVKTIGELNTFFGAGVEVSYFFNRSIRSRKANSKQTVRTSGNTLSSNPVLSTSPTLLLSYGVEFDKGIFKIGKKSRVKLDLLFDRAFLGLGASPSNQYFGTLLYYQLSF